MHLNLLAMMATPIDLSLIITIVLSLATGIFNLGKVSNRLAAVEKDMKQVKKELKETRSDLTIRIDEVKAACNQIT